MQYSVLKNDMYKYKLLKGLAVKWYILSHVTVLVLLCAIHVILM